MKQRTKKLIAILAMSFITVCSFSQESQDETVVVNQNPRWLSEKGYWVIESNLHSPTNCTIRFYNNDDVMIYTETLAGVKLNPAKRKVKMKLKKVLETSLLAWEQNKVAGENKEYVAAILR